MLMMIAGLKSWNQPKTTGRPPTARHGHAMIIDDKKIFLFGGKGASYFNDLYILSCGTLAWQKPRVTGPHLFHFPTSFYNSFHCPTLFDNFFTPISYILFLKTYHIILQLILAQPSFYNSF
jgi:hypothetical protein